MTGAYRGEVMRRLLTPGWIAFHLLSLVLVVAMLALAGWQFSRAAGGNALSWGYTLQWPVFAGFLVFVWAREARRVLRGGQADAGAPPPVGTTAGSPSAAIRPVPGGGVARLGSAPVVTRRPSRLAYDDRDDPALAAYNRYLAWLAAHPGARPGDYPG